MFEGLMSNNRGSMAIEASLVVPVIILFIVSVMYIGLLLFQQAHMQACADDAAERGAAVWDDKEKNIEIGKVGIQDLGADGLYRRLIFDKEPRIDKVMGYLQSKSAGYDLLPGGSKAMKVELKNYPVYKKLIVRIEGMYRLPLGNLLQIFGFSRDYVVKAESQAVVEDPAEFIRNVDFLMDLEKEVENNHPEIKDVGNKSRGIMAGIKDKINGFFR